MSAEGRLFESGATVTYNEVTIDNIVTSKVASEIKYNAQGTAVKYIEYTFEFEAIVHPGAFITQFIGQDATDEALELIRNKLQEPRKTFQYRDKGFGDFVVDSNQSSEDADVDYGPKPLRLTFEPIADNKAARINWSIMVRVAPCDDHLLEFWSTSSVKINKSGYQTLTRTGRVEFAATSSNDNLGNRATVLSGPFIDSLVSPTSMEGYHLEHDFKFSNNNRMLDFTLVYSEIETPNTYPLGVVSINCEHSMGSSLLSSNPLEGSAYRSWKNDMSCTITLRPRVPQLRAWEIFSALVSDRLNQAVTVEVENVNGEDVITRVKVPIVLSMKIKESMFQHSMTFSLTWVSFTQTIADIFNRSGLGKPFIERTAMNVPITWNDWVIDMRNNAQNRSGAYPLSSLGITEQINNSCTGTASIPPNVPDTTRGEILVQVPAIFDPVCPPENASWLDYQGKCEIESSSNKAVHRRFKLDDIITRTDDQIPPFSPSTSVSRQYDTGSSESDHFVQDFGNDTHLGVITGYAVRIGRPTEPPRVTSIGGKTAILQKDKSKVSNVVLSANNNCPVHVTQWRLKYEILGFPDGNIETTVASTGDAATFQ